METGKHVDELAKKETLQEIHDLALAGINLHEESDAQISTHSIVGILALLDTLVIEVAELKGVKLENV